MTLSPPAAWTTATPPLPAGGAGGSQLDLHAHYPTGSALAVARATTVAQANAVGTPLRAPLDVVDHSSPSAAVAALLARHQAVPTPAQARAFSDLDRLEVPLRQSLTRVIDAFVASEEATAAAYAKADPGELRRLAEHLGGPSSATEPLRLGPESLDLVPMLSARLVLLDAAAALERAVAEAGVGRAEATSFGAAQTTNTSCAEPAGSVPAVVAIDAAGEGKGEANCYTTNYALVVDLGGRDTYNNNAGGGALAAGALVDLGSQDDRYRGANGGGWLGSGFLYDNGGDDTYTGTQHSNGGSTAGAGFLFDGWGDDTYTAGGVATNGGADSGSGMLVDGGGNDSYKATPGMAGTNGGAGNSVWVSGTGALVDLGQGTDSYRTGGIHDGGAWLQFQGGNGSGSLAKGLLIDAGGSGDTYTDISITTNVAATHVDDSKVPKGAAGAQIDQCRSGADAAADAYPAAVCGAAIGAVPNVSVDDVTYVEKDSGTSTATFTVSLTSPASPWAVPVVVDYASAEGTASAGSDYTAASGRLVFSPNEAASQTISVPVAGDTLTEDNESFFLVMTQVAGAAIAKGRGQGTILNDDAPAVRINDSSLSEGDSGTKAFNFAVSLSVPTTKVVSLGYATADGTAVAPGDYAPTSGSLSFAPGTTAATISALVDGDTVVEPNEWFFVNLSGVTNATVAKAQGKATIFNDDF